MTKRAIKLFNDCYANACWAEDEVSRMSGKILHDKPVDVEKVRELVGIPTDATKAARKFLAEMRKANK